LLFAFGGVTLFENLCCISVSDERQFLTELN